MDDTQPQQLLRAKYSNRLVALCCLKLESQCMIVWDSDGETRC